MFSRWEIFRSTAIKRVCKFLLKKKLGEFILGDIDLDQLDVQLRDGTIHLSDLALNVDFLNQKLAGVAVLVKEGSIKSLSIKIPWKRKNCQIEVEVLELVLVPFVQSNISPNDADSWIPSRDEEQHMCIDSEKIELGTVHENSGAISQDVHEGVKTIAKIVKWFLTSFHVRINEFFVAFDPHSDVEERGSAFHRSLVLRVKEIDFGTFVCEDAKAKLTNFVKFQEAVIEFLQMEDVDNSPQLHSGSETGFDEKYVGQSTITILTGPRGGFSGTLNLSIPWENGSLDIHKVDADVSIDSVELRVLPSSIKWVIAIWESLKHVGTAQWSPIHKAGDSSDHNSGLYVCSSTLGSSMPDPDPDTDTTSSGIYSKDIFPAINQERVPDALLTRAHVIHDWVPESINQEDRTDLESDYGASVDEFFECFDGMRSYQANSGSSGIWNWTCSVFSAISVASNLASGSGHVPKEQNVETNVRATIDEVFIVLSFMDEDQTESYDSSNIVNSLLNGLSSDSYMSCHSSMNMERSTVDEVNSMKIHHLEARCQHLALDLQTYPQIMKFGASLGHITADEYYDTRNHAEGSSFFDYKNDSYYQMLLNKHLQGQVQGALPPFPFSAQDHDSESSVSTCRNGLIKIRLLESFGKCSCQYTVSSTGLDGKPKASSSFSVHLPPCVLWVHFPLVTMLLNLFKQVEDSFKKSSTNKDFVTDALSERHNSSSLDDAESGNISYITMSQRASLRGNIVLPQARVIVCFPSELYGAFKHSASLDKFIVLEHSSSAGDVSDVFQLPKGSSPNNNSCTPSISVHLNMGNFDIYLVKSSSKNALGDRFHALGKQPFSAEKILSVTNRSNDYHSGITMLWQKGPVTGPWMASRTWSLSKLHDQHRNKVVGKGAEYSSVTTAEDLEETSSSIRQELILSSAFLYHVKFSCVCVNIGSHNYQLLNQLLSYLLAELSGGAHGMDTDYKEIKNKKLSLSDSYASQTSVHMECDLLDICITLDEVTEVSRLIQKELQGSWNCLKLKVKKFELLSASNVGGISEAKFSWLNHGEGELWGSIFNRNGKASELNQDLLLITCKNSALRRGAGEGTNALSFGSAGTTVTHIQNPQLCQSYTSIIVCSGTAVAPGGRLDWISAICLYFSLPYQENEQSGKSKASVDGAASETLFFLDLVDVGLSYEPHIKDPLGANGVPNGDHSFAMESNEETDRQYVGCLLAAASLSLSNHTKANSSTVDYNIQLQDAGLLICESTGTRNDSGDYHVGLLQETGYVKVAQVALVEGILRIKGLLWEIECSESHICLDTCHDTTYGLVRLVAQLQQLYAPDVEDAIVHLQSRWNTIQEAQKDHNSNDVADNSESPAVGLNSEKNYPMSDEDHISVGLLDEILENAFHISGECKSPSGHHEIQSHVSLDERILGDKFKLNINNNSAAGDASALNFPLDASSFGSGMVNTLQTSARKPCSPELIESYCASDLLQKSTLTVGHHSPKEDHKCGLVDTTHRNMECGKGGWYNDSALMIVENHISKILNQPEGKQHEQEEFTSGNSNPVGYCIPKGRILLKNIDVRWRMYAGIDWIKQRNNSYNRLTINGRDGSVCLEFTLSGLKLQYDMYPDGEINVSKLSVSVQDFHLYDMSRDAPWKMVLGYYHSKDHPRESCAKAFKLGLEAVRPDPSTPLEDYRLLLEFLPMRLHLDQDQLNFLVSFFGKDSFVDETCSPLNNSSESKMSGRKSRSFGSQTIVEEALLPFFQKCDVRPLVVRVDYIPRHFDPAALSRGNYAELLNLVAWKGIDLHLKHVCAVGVYGWSSICETVFGEWLEDISHNQVHKLLKGLAPIRSLFAVSSGTSKLVSLPVKTYRKDHKLLKGIQRGAMAFIRSISIEAVGLGVHLAAGAHDILLQTEYILSSIPTSGSLSETSRRKSNVRSNQPEDAQQGIQQAYESLSDGLSRSASALLGTPLKAYQRGAGSGSALANALRAAPAAAVAPVSASARAVHCALLGLRNSLDPEHKKESMEKYLGSS